MLEQNTVELQPNDSAASEPIIIDNPPIEDSVMEQNGFGNPEAENTSIEQNQGSSAFESAAFAMPETQKQRKKSSTREHAPPRESANLCSLYKVRWLFGWTKFFMPRPVFFLPSLLLETTITLWNARNLSC